VSSRWFQVSFTGTNIYVGANPLRSGSRKRTKECMATVRHLHLDLDTDGDARLALLRASDAVPMPTAVLSTSLGKYQTLWRVVGFTFEEQENTLKVLATAFGGDLACTDCNRVLRLPGFLNCKHDPAYRVTVEYTSDCPWNPDYYRVDIPAADAVLSSRVIPSRKHPGRHTNSEHDWAWVLHKLAYGKDAAKLTRSLASRRLILSTRTGPSISNRPLAHRRRSGGRRCHDTGSSPRIRDSRTTLLPSSAGDCAHCSTVQRMIARRGIA
jgi:hypothetical protein